jgi:hypothetical protein
MGTPTQKYENPAIKMLNAIILKTLRQVVWKAYHLGSL